MSIADTDKSYAVQDIPESRQEQIRFKFRITLEGVMLLIVIMLVGFAAWHSGTNLLYLIFSILIALYLVHGFMMSVNLSKLKASAVSPETVIAGQPFDINVSLTNQKKHTATSAIRLEHRLEKRSAPLGAVFFSQVPALQARDAFYSTTIPRRGLYRIETAVISTRYPFGFEERLQLRPMRRHVLALPPTYGVAAIVANLPFGFGDQDSNVRGTGTELYGLREYVPGEHARHVHWRTSARAQKVMIAEFTRDERKQVFLLLNNMVQSELREPQLLEKFENAIILTASLAKHLINAGFEVGLITGQSRLEVGQGPAHLALLLRELATLQVEDLQNINVPSESLLHITFHDFASDGNAFPNAIPIDSTKWKPPLEEFGHGEKQI